MLRITVNASAPDPASIGRAAAVLRAGGVAAIPTDTLYGLAADPFNPAAVSRLFTIKDRDADKAIPLVAAGIEQVHGAVRAAAATRRASRSPALARAADVARACCHASIDRGTT